MKAWIWLVFCGLAFGQGSIITSTPVAVNSSGQPILATIAITSTNPCGSSPTYVNCGGASGGTYTGALPPASLATTYTDLTMGTPCAGSLTLLYGAGCSNPGTTDGRGNIIAFTNPGTYYCTEYGSGVTAWVQPCIFPASGTGVAAGATGQAQVRNSLGNFAAELGTHYADKFPGADIGAQINAAIAALPSTTCTLSSTPCGGTVVIPPLSTGCYSFSTTIAIPTDVLVNLVGVGPSTCLLYTGGGNAITVNWSGNHYPARLANFMLQGPGSGGVTVGIYIGSSVTFTDQVTIDSVQIGGKTGPGFGTGILLNNSAFGTTIQNSVITNNNIGVQSNSGNIPLRILNSNLSSNVTAQVSMTANAAALTLIADDIEPVGVGSCGIKVTANATVADFGSHYENPAAVAGNGDLFICGTANNATFTKYGGDFLEDAGSGTNTQFVTWKGDFLGLYGVSVNTLGATVTEVVNSTTASSTVFTQIRNGAGVLIQNSLGGTTPTWQDCSFAGSGGGGGCRYTKMALGLSDQGQCTMTAGTCAAQPLAQTYLGAPVCEVTWTGSGALAGSIKVSSSTTTVTPSSSNGADTAVVNFVCFGLIQH